MKKNPVVHFEMPYRDASRVAAFYAKAFGWEMNQHGAEMKDYITAATTETDEAHMILRPGAINGGFYPIDTAPDATAPSVVIAVDDIEASIQGVQEAGGTMLGEPVDIPGIGRYVSFTDTEGNRASMLQPVPAGK